MRVLYLVNLYPKVSHTFIRREIEGVEASGIEVERVSLRRVHEPLVDPADRAEEQHTWVVLDQSPLVLLLATLSTALRSPLRWLVALRDARRLGRPSERGILVHLAYLAEACSLQQRYGNTIDHVHAHFATNPAAVALLWNRLGGPDYSFTAHGTLDFDDPPAVSLAEKIRRSAFTVAVCQFGRGQLMRWAAEDCWDKLHVVRCGVEKSFLEHEPVPVPTAARIVCVARFSPEKALPVLLRAVRAVVDSGRDIELVLAGDGPDHDSVVRLIQELEIEEQVKLPGLLSGQQVREAILDARAMVLPSFSEGLPVVIMEALALRRPVIASAITGIPELVKPGQTGWLVPVGSIDQLASAMCEALDASTADLTSLGERGAKLVAKLHDARSEAARLADLFRKTKMHAGSGSPTEIEAIKATRPASSRVA
ncbi:MAG: colanic acid/amylovoran biosynthesis glycosyltransferase [Planctomycetota bacterium]|jgi:colanic acid/amylovoran biosynthesis glycosyltransferase